MCGWKPHGILQASAILFARHSGLSLEGAVSAAIADAEEDMNKRAVIAIGVVAPLINGTGPISHKSQRRHGIQELYAQRILKTTDSRL